MNEQPTLFNYQNVVSENKSLEDLFFESGEWNTFDDENNLVKSKVKLFATKKIQKNGKPLFVLVMEHCFNENDNIVNDIECRTLEELLNWFESKKQEAITLKEASDKGIMFDNRRYWWKTEIKGNKVEFIEKVIEW